MNLKIKTNTFYKIVIVLVFFLNLGFLNITMNITGISMYFSIVITLISFFVFLFKANDINRHLLIISYCILLLIFLIYQFLRPRYFFADTSELLRMYLPFLLIFLAFPISQVITKTNNFKLLELICILGYAILALRTIYWGMFNFFNINMAPGSIIPDWTRALGGRMFTRLPGIFLNGYIMIVSWYNLLYKQKVIYLGGLFFMLFYSVIVTQSRAGIIELLMISLIILLFYTYNAKNRLVRGIFVTIFILFVFILAMPHIAGFIDTFSANNLEYGGSTLTRQKGYQFYLDLWLNNRIFGIGLIPDNIQINRWLTYYLSDYNFIVNLYEFGYIGFFILLIPFFYGIKVSFLIVHKKLCTNDSILFIQIFLTIFLIIDMFFQNIYLAQNITLLPLYMGISISAANRIKEKPYCM